MSALNCVCSGVIEKSMPHSVASREPRFASSGAQTTVTVSVAERRLSWANTPQVTGVRSVSAL